MIVASVVTVAISIMITARSPVWPVIWMKAPSNPAVAKSNTKTPAGIRIPMNAKSPSNWPWIVVVPVPRIIPVASSVNYNSTVNIRVTVARVIANVNNFRSRIVDINIFNVIDF